MATPEVGSATETCILLKLKALLYRTPENLPVCNCIGRVSQSSVVFIDYSARSSIKFLSVYPVDQFASLVRLVIRCGCLRSKASRTTCNSRE